jgi:two-component system sensor histidine kinase AgrC
MVQILTIREKVRLMRFDTLLINLFFTAISAITVLFYAKFNELAYNKNRTIPFVIIFSILNGVLSTKVSSLGDLANTIKPIILILVSILLIYYLLEISLLKSITVFLLLTIGMGIGNALSLMILGPFVPGYVVKSITSNSVLYIITCLISAIITLLLMFAIKPVNGAVKKILNSKELVVELSVTFFIMTANVGLYYYVKVFNFFAFLIITILSLIYAAFAIYKSTIILKKQMEAEEKKQQEFYNKSFEDTLFDMRRFRHDWKNNMAVLNSMLETNKVKEARDYLHEIMDFNVVHSSNTFFEIKNAGLFGIISSKQHKAQELGLEFEIIGSGEIKDIPEIKISELCEIVGIFLDNAIDESHKLNEKIEMRYSNTEHGIEISIKNKCEEDIDISQLDKMTTKGDGHGNGLKIADQIVGKYKNIKNYRSYENSDKTFEQLLVIEKGL